jgi:hypothetical protein
VDVLIVLSTGATASLTFHGFAKAGHSTGDHEFNESAINAWISTLALSPYPLLSTLGAGELNSILALLARH